LNPETLVTYYRDWWMSEATPRTIDSEVQATIDLINLAFEALKKPVYLGKFSSGFTALYCLNRNFNFCLCAMCFSNISHFLTP
jgi:hypothetical protein